MEPTPASVEAVEGAVGHRFDDIGLLVTALTHGSYVAENPDAESYERLEFLGDAVLELVTTEIIYEAMDSEPEGTMTKVRATVVDEATLATVAAEWLLPDAIRLGVGEERTGGRGRSSILSDVTEAVIAAVYLDGGYDAATTVVRRTFVPIIADRVDGPTVMDARSALQEMLAKRGQVVQFHYERSGPDHATVFAATAVVDGAVVGQGSGGSKKAAAIAAAQDALDGRGAEKLRS